MVGFLLRYCFSESAAQETLLSRMSRWSLIALMLVLAAVYAPVALELVRDWIRDPNYSHGFLIPAVSGFLVWQRRRKLAVLPFRGSRVGFLGVVGSSALLVVGVAGAEVFTQRMSLVLLMTSLVVFLAGWAWLRALAFPLGFLLLAIPMPYVLYYSMTGPMQAFAARCAIFGLHLVGVPAVSQGNIIHLPQTSLEVAEACSGIRSLYAFLALGALLAHTLPVPGWAKGIVFLFTFPLSILGNAVRVWGTGIGAHTVGPQAAQGTVHELFGVIVFAAAIGIFLLLRQGARVLWSSAR